MCLTHQISLEQRMIGQWENECFSLSALPLRGPGSISGHTPLKRRWAPSSSLKGYEEYYAVFCPQVPDPVDDKTRV